MTKEVVILIADDDAGHARLIEKNLQRAGLHNTIRSFENGQEILDSLYCRGAGPKRAYDVSYLLLLDIRMPKVDGVEVLRQVNADSELRKLPMGASGHAAGRGAEGQPPSMLRGACTESAKRPRNARRTLTHGRENS